MKGRSVTTVQKIYHNNLCQIVGCIACRKELIFNDWVSIHHINGRTKPDAHWCVLPLCAGHHQDNGTAIAVHPFKKRFENHYGQQLDLMMDCVDILLSAGVDVPSRVSELTELRCWCYDKIRRKNDVNALGQLGTRKADERLPSGDPVYGRGID